MKVIDLFECKWNVKCPVCGSILELDIDDATSPVIECPECTNTFTWRDNTVDAKMELPPVFPRDFEDNNDGKAIGYDEINKWVKQGIKYFRENPDSFAWFTASGDSAVFIMNRSEYEEYHIVVTNNYFDMFCPYSRLDKETQKKNNWKCENKGFVKGRSQ